jgi:hypothetical protein
MIANFPAIRLQFALTRTAYKFEQDVRRAQALAFTSAQYKDSQGVVYPINAYGVNINILKNKQYLLFADGISGVHLVYDPTTDYTVENIDFSAAEPGVIIQDIFTPENPGVHCPSLDISFVSPGPTTAIHCVLNTFSSVDIVFALASDPSKTKTVYINTAGLVEVR